MNGIVSSHAALVVPAADLARDTRGRTVARVGAVGPRVPRWVAVLLRVPLAGKIAGANLLIVGVVCGTLNWSPGLTPAVAAVTVAVAMGAALAVNVVLVLLALRPIGMLEETARAIWRGEMDARVPESLLADAGVQRVGSAFNVLLDGLTSDRERMHALAADAIRAGDRERANLARELHDSTAQTLAALLLELRVVAEENRDPRIAERLQRVRRIAGDVLEEVKLLAHTAHPRVLDDLGLVAALNLLVRETQERSATDIRVEAMDSADAIPPAETSVLYRVAQEAVNNAVRHSRARHLTLALTVRDGVARLTIADDGEGFDVEAARARREGMGLFTMQERVAIVGGALEIVSAQGGGTRLVATLPVLPRQVMT